MTLLLQARIRGCDGQSRRSALRHTVGDWRPSFWRLSPSEEQRDRHRRGSTELAEVRRRSQSPGLYASECPSRVPLPHPPPEYGGGVGGGPTNLHEHFCCNRGFAAATSLDAVGPASRQAGSPLSRSTSCSRMPPSLAAPRACLAWRLRDFATNRHE